MTLNSHLFHSADNIAVELSMLRKRHFIFVLLVDNKRAEVCVDFSVIVMDRVGAVLALYCSLSREGVGIYVLHYVRNLSLLLGVRNLAIICAQFSNCDL